MKEEKKKTESTGKILSFDINNELLEDPDVDNFVKESLIKEADELEAELNQNPDLVGIGASDDLFLSIVGKLKEQGIWEEDGPEAGQDADGNGVSAGRDENTVNGISAKQDENTMRGVFAGQDKNTGEVAAAAQNEPRLREVLSETAERSVEVGPDESTMRGVAAGHDEDTMRGVFAGQDKNTGEVAAAAQNEPGLREALSETAERSVEVGPDENVVNGVSAAQNVRSGEEIAAEFIGREKLYQLLPEEDRKNLELGRQMQQREQTKRIRTRRRIKVMKNAGIVAAVFVLIFGVSMTSDANRRLVLRVWDGLAENLGFRVSTDYLGEESNMRSKTSEEILAMEEISEKIGIKVIDFSYLPKGMEYQRCEIMEDQLESMLFYSYNESIFSVTMINLVSDSSDNYALDNNAILIDTIINDQDIEIELWKLNAEKSEETYMAEIEYNNCRYILNGMLPLEEMRNILKSIYIL